MDCGICVCVRRRAIGALPAHVSLGQERCSISQPGAQAPENGECQAQNVSVPPTKSLSGAPPFSLRAEQIHSRDVSDDRIRVRFLCV
jgi:hypothetical protein